MKTVLGLNRRQFIKAYAELNPIQREVLEKLVSIVEGVTPEQCRRIAEKQRESA